MTHILLVDDDKNFLKVYSEILASNGFSVTSTATGKDCLQKVRTTFFHIAIIDILMPEMNGIELLKILRQEYPHMLILMLTGEGSIPGAVKAMELGAFTYMLKPIEIETMLYHVKKAEEFYVLNSENVSLRNKISYKKINPQLIGHSEYTKNILQQISYIAPTNSSVLITGESGTGKEVMVDLIHANSTRLDGPLVKVNCGALAETLLESELFGYEKGAFTGANTRKIGYFEQCSGGTLFLDEIGDMPVHLQQKLLRVIQEKSFERVGSAKTIHSDFRLICATNRDLNLEISQSNFREDLFYRINVIPLKTLPLRDRVEDIPDLITYYIKFFCTQMNKKEFEIQEAALKLLKSYSWKGNVREIKNFCERLVVFSNGIDVSIDQIKTYISEESLSAQTSETHNLKEAEYQFQHDFLWKHLNENNWNITKTAALIGITRKTLQLKIKQLDIKKV